MGLRAVTGRRRQDGLRGLAAGLWPLLLGPSAICTALLGGAVGAAEPSQVYRWVDEDGVVHYTDSVPPDSVEKARTELRPDGIPVRTIPPAKTPEEIERERQLERLRAQQRALVERRAAQDRVLLRTFRSEEDLIAARDRQIHAVDAMIRITKGHVTRQQHRLAELRAEAADLERAGETVGERLEAQLAQTEASLNRALGTILQREQQKQEIRAAFSRDLERFQELTAAERDAPQIEPVEPPPPLQNLVECTGRADCDRLWEQALRYLKSHTTLPMTTVGTDVAMTEPPPSSAETALTLTRLWHGDGSGAWIFLDLQCGDRPADDCRNGPRLEVLNGFRDALKPPATHSVGDRADRPPAGTGRPH